MEYKIISVTTVFSSKKALQKLMDSVNDAIMQGWQPTGGVSLLGTSYCQAVIKRRG